MTEAQADPPAAHTIPVYQMKLTGVEDMEWQTLFTGFDELHVITFSVGIPQVEKAMQLVRRGDMIIGSTSPIKQNLAELLAEQEFSLASVCSSAYLQSRVKDGTFRGYVANEQIHSKVYLLRFDAGRTRLILGSANFSTQAWASRQKDKDRMRIDYSNIQDKALASSLQKLANELPVTLEPGIIGSVLFVKYSAIRLWTGLDFRNRGRLLQRITGMFGRS